jgi:hypothetical protein
MIELREYEGGLTAPVAICDACGEVITDGKMALYVWDQVGGPLQTVHKGKCDRAMEGSDVKGGKRFSIELDCLPVQLGRNLGLKTVEDWKAAMEHADAMQMLG